MRILSRILLISCFSLTCALPSIIHTAISCDKTDFTLQIKFNETFTGSILTAKGDPNCVYLNASIHRSESYDVKIPLSGCETRKNAEGNLENEIVVQTGPEFNAKTDKRFLLTCIPANPIFRDSQVTVSFGGITVDSEASTVATLINSPKIDYRVVVLDGDDPNSPPLDHPLAVGDRVTYTVHLASSVHGRIGRCWASDGSSELELSDNKGCSTQKQGEVWGDFEVSRDDKGTTFVNHIKAWAFPTSNEVNIFCNLHVCVHCEQATCRNRARRFGGQWSRNEPDSDGDDLTPPISVRTSFRLRRDSPETPKIQEERQSSPSYSKQNIALIILLPVLHFCSRLV